MNFDGGMNYVECDLDPGVTLPQWRRERARVRSRRRHPVRRLGARLRGTVKP